MTWIVADKNHLGGQPRIEGTRIPISLILELLACGMTIPEIVEEYPSLNERAVQGALAELAETDLLLAQ
jgi:uncharacterized protein (DUF433 family)